MDNDKSAGCFRGCGPGFPCRCPARQKEDRSGISWMDGFAVVTETLRTAQRIRRAKNESGKTLFRRERVDVDPTAGAIEANIAIDQRKNRVIATEPDVLAR